jgi:hypothetical protein
MLNVLKDMKESYIEHIRSWNYIMVGYSRAVGEKDQKKALSVWKYLPSQQSYESIELELIYGE